MLKDLHRLCLDSEMAADAAGITVRKLNLYIEQGLLEPSEGDVGRGRSRHYSFMDMLCVCILRELESFGIAPRHLRSIAKSMNNGELEAVLDSSDHSLLYVFRDKKSFIVARPEIFAFDDTACLSYIAVDIKGIAVRLNETLGSK